MNSIRKYLGIIILLIPIIVGVVLWFGVTNTIIGKYNDSKNQLEKLKTEVEKLEKNEQEIRRKVEALKNVDLTITKKLYFPNESDLGNDTLFFTLYNDFIEMIHSNSIKIKSIKYQYNPENDPFVQSGGNYFVFDVNVELVSNYTNLGKLIEEIYQYPYYMKINRLDVKPYNKDKKILISNLSITLYSHTEPLIF